MIGFIDAVFSTDFMGMLVVLNFFLVEVNLYVFEDDLFELVQFCLQQNMQKQTPHDVARNVSLTLHHCRSNLLTFSHHPGRIGKTELLCFGFEKGS